MVDGLFRKGNVDVVRLDGGEYAHRLTLLHVDGYPVKLLEDAAGKVFYDRPTRMVQVSPVVTRFYTEKINGWNIKQGTTDIVDPVTLEVKNSKVLAEERNKADRAAIKKRGVKRID